MSSGVRLGDGGHLEVVRSDGDPDRLRATVERLRAAAGPGVVEIRSVVDDGERVEVVLAYAGRSPVVPVAAEEAARIGASVSAQLGDAHARGMTHGAVVLEHVLVDADGVVRLCGWGPRAGDAHDDVRAVGALLRALVGDDASPRAAAVNASAARCDVDDDDALPSMHALAAALASIGSPARTIRAPERDDAPQRHVPIAALTAVAAIIVVVAVALWPHASRARPVVSAPTTSTTSTTSTSTTEPRSHRVWPAAAPRILDHDGRWSFGTEDDLALEVGDWDCNGTKTPLLVQRDGAIFVIDGEWIDGATARHAATVEHARDVRVDHGPTCDLIVVRTPNGDVTPSLAPA